MTEGPHLSMRALYGSLAVHAAHHLREDLVRCG